MLSTSHYQVTSADRTMGSLNTNSRCEKGKNGHHEDFVLNDIYQMFSSCSL